MTEALVQVENLSRNYQSYRAINELNFDLSAGEVLGFLGPNGAGKSTTMQVISGNLAPTAGQVRIAGYDILKSPRDAKQHLGYLPEHPPVYLDASVNEFLRYCARLHRVSQNQINKSLDRVKQQCGLTEVGKRIIGRLSKGYQQRIGIAQAIIHDPAVLILDEPTVGLDPIQIREIRDLIRNLGRERSVILSSHILSEVQAVCDRVQIIRAGKLIYHAPIESLDQKLDCSVRVAFRNPPALSDLSSLAGVAEAELLGEGRFRLSLEVDSNADGLIEASQQQNWGLFELIPERQSLEDLFIELTADSPTESTGNAAGGAS